MATAKKAAPKKKSAARKPAAKTVAAAKVVKTKNVGLFAKKYSGDESVASFFRTPAFVGSLLAEIIGVFLLVIVVLATQASPLYVLFGILGISLATYAFSGAHINPVITLGAMVTRRVSVVRGIFYLIAQVLGALLAYVVMTGFIGGSPAVSAEMAAYGQQAPELFRMAVLPEGKEWFIIFTELLGAGIIGLFFARALKYKRSVFTFAITAGSGLFVALLLALTTAGYIGGGFALNPAIAVAMQTFNGEIHLGWALLVYALAPVIGGILGFFINDLIAATGADAE
ncbi:MAG: aquaporin [Candidatus Nomurabacteria bacterium]|jgi:glycerol uptake facilitator-like aquaporin|nr:aquaporin [Candidatus Nomurabacteria bacterium]